MFLILCLWWQKKIIFQQVKKKFEHDFFFQKQRLRAAVFRKMVKKRLFTGLPFLYQKVIFLNEDLMK